MNEVKFIRKEEIDKDYYERGELFLDKSDGEIFILVGNYEEYRLFSLSDGNIYSRDSTFGALLSSSFERLGHREIEVK